MHKPLEGVRVLEWGVFHAGPGATAILSDMGAEVIKLEEPKKGDPLRRSRGYKDINFNLPCGVNLFNEEANRGKKSVTVNLAHDEGRQIAYRLVAKSDVFFTNLRPGAVARKKMDYKSLSPLNPRLIYASVTGYGTRGPDRDVGGFDYQGQGRSGMMYAFGEPDMPPQLGQFGIVDQATAIMASYQIVIALLMRERFGIGQEVDVSLLSTASYLLYINNLVALVVGRPIARHEQLKADPLRNYYCCQDGKWVIQTQPPGEAHWGTVCRVLGLPELADDPRFNKYDGRLAISHEVVPIFNEAFASKPRDEWIRLFHEANLIICPVNTPLEVTEDPQMIENEYIVDFEHPAMGKIRIPGFPIHFSGAAIDHNLIAPKLGEHTEEVLKELGGYSDEEIAHFREDRAI